MKAGFSDFGIVVTLSLSATVGSAMSSAAGAQTGRIALDVPEIIEVESGVETVIRISVAPEGAPPVRAMLLLRGVPSSVALTRGRRFSSGIWVVNVSAIRDVRLLAEPGARHDRQITFSLVTLEGETLGEASSRLVIASEPGSATADISQENTENRVVTLRATPPDRGGPPSPNTRILGVPDGRTADERKTLILIARGDQNFAEGKINAARLLYQRAAELGSARAAFAVGRTYDPAQLKGLPIVGGIGGDRELARQWYEKARDMGSNNAKLMLEKFGQR
jgi:hypothetical protein